MFVIDTRVTKDDILEYLTIQLQREETAVVFLLELPSFLASKIAFGSFLKSIQSYPRPITWQTNNPVVADIIRTTSVVEQNASHAQIIDENDEQDNFNSESIPDEIVLQNPRPSVTNQLRTVVSGYLFVLPVTTTPTLELDDEDDDELDKWMHSIENTRKVFTKDWFRSQLAGNNAAPDTDSKSNQTPPIQKNVYEPLPKQPGIKRKSVRWGRLFMTILLLLAIAGGIWWWYFAPDITQTEVVIEPISQSKTTVFSLPKSALSNQPITFEAHSTVTPTGPVADDAQIARGKVVLINKSNKPYDLNNAGFYLFSGQKRYLVSKNTTLEDTFTLPANSENDKYSFEIRAQKPGDEYELAINSQLTITNLILQDVGSNIQAKVIESVHTRTNQRRFTAQDAATLTAQNQAQNEAFVTKKTQDSPTQIYYLPTIVKTEITQSNTSASIQDFVDTVEQKATFITTVSGLTTAQISAVIATQNSTISQVVSLSKVSLKEEKDAVTGTAQTIIFEKVDIVALQKNLDAGQDIATTSTFNVRIVVTHTHPGLIELFTHTTPRKTIIVAPTP